MRKNGWIWLVLAIALILGTAGCTENPVIADDGTQAESADPGTHTTIPAEGQLPENFMEFYREAEAKYAMFTRYRSDIYFNGTEYLDGVRYSVVNIRAMMSLHELRTYCERHFDGALTNTLMETTVGDGYPLFAVIDGWLCRVDNYTAPFEYNVGHSYEATLESVENGNYTVRVEAAMTDDGREISAAAYCTYTVTENGEIRFTSFELMVEKLVEALEKMPVETEPVEPAPFDPESFAAYIPAEWAQRLFWHQIRDTDHYLFFFVHRGPNSTFDRFSDEPPKMFSIYYVDSESTDFIGHLQADLPEDLSYDTVCPVVAYDGAGEMECEFVVQLTDGDTVFYVSFDNFGCAATNSYLTFTCRGVLPEERVNELKGLYPDAFRKAEKYFWHYTLRDFENETPGEGIVSEGYTVEYDIPHPYDAGNTFPVHIHLPRINDDSVYAEKFNLAIRQDYERRYGDTLNATVYGTNSRRSVSVTWNAVTTGDVITVYIVDRHGKLGSGSGGCSYDIYYYDTVQKRFLAMDEFLSYYAGGMFEDYTGADIVQFMNEHTFETDGRGAPYTLSIKDIQGVIPSVFGDGKIDVVYQGHSLEGQFATRVLFSPYPSYGAAHPKTGLPTTYTYRLTYHDYTDCDDWKTHGSPQGYRLTLCERAEGQYDRGYYEEDYLLTEDIAERPESYPASVYGEYYTPVREDEYGNLCVFIDHETDKGHLEKSIPFYRPDR